MSVRSLEVDERFDFERSKHQAFFLPWYEANGFTVIEDRAAEKSPWDVRIGRDRQVWTVDEKAVRNVWGAMCIELVQDLLTQSWGWAYGDVDALLFGMWKDRGATTPARLYWVQHRRLVPWVTENWFRVRKKLDSTGWGETFFVLADWEDLERDGLAVAMPV